MTNQRYVVLSVNENPQYIFYLPLTVWAWRKFGWEPTVFFTKRTPEFFLAMKYIYNSSRLDTHKLIVDGYGSETVAQISRLYTACLYGHKDDYIMTSDVDMLPLSNYWEPTHEKITVWGHDLTGFQHMPICYIGMHRWMWEEVMHLKLKRNHNEAIERDLDSMPNAKSTDSVKRWVVDQDLITDRINAIGLPKDFIPRGTLANGYPVGRVDRSAWSLDHPQLIDCHMLRDIYLNPDHLARTLLLLYKAFPGEEFAWFTDYATEYAKLVKNG